jgi:hypothetical protein
MKNIITILLFSLISLFSSCEDLLFESPSSGKEEVFKQFWNEIDCKYSFFEEKNINWDKAYNRINNIDDQMSDEAFFDTLSIVLDLLKDGHCSLTSTFNEHKNPNFYLQSPQNYNARLISDYYAHGWPDVTGSFSHFELANGKVAYIRYSSFMLDVTEDDIDYLLRKYSNTNGIIFDIRDNTGGSVANVFTLVSRFAKSKTLVYMTRDKAGPDHLDFTDPKEVYINHSGENYYGKVCVLTNRMTFSAGSVFTLCMRELPNITIVGDTTGGGLGLPIGTELANGWQLRFSGTQILATNNKCYEMGIPPDVTMQMDANDEQNGIDSIIENAVDIILNQ